ncbi:Root phototropism protein 3 [Camellia lanceoleosa]|uniref:Root phototropism protein 3 n=1 Tax=Camellia lanceoleosa TaxID=1840588 RepID=A0ACC0J2B3_9ERIC|nr:Root phototropism protein 3 [Camellia lanceoleosa]
MWDSESELVEGRECNNGVLNPKTDGKMSLLNRYFSTDIPSDFLIQIGDSTFHLHKKARRSKKRKLWIQKALGSWTTMLHFCQHGVPVVPPIYNYHAQTHKEHDEIQATGYHFLGSKPLANLRTRKQMTIMPWV